MRIQAPLTHAVRLIVLGLGAASILSAQASRIAFTTTTAANLTIPNPLGRVVADFNQDGRLDLLVTGSSVELLLGDGTGTLSLANEFLFLLEPAAAAVADFNGDGYLDAAITQDLFTKESFYGDVCGSLVGMAIALGPDFSPFCVLTPGNEIAAQAADFDGDGRPDIALVSSTAQGLSIYSRFNFSPFPTYRVTSVPGGAIQASSMAAPIDLNGDGRLDLVIGHRGGVKTFLGNGDATFTVGATIASNATSAVAVGTLDGDNRPDIAWVESGATGRLIVGLAGAGNTFTSRVIATSTVAPGMTDVAIADFDQDGRNDIVVADNGGGTIRIFFGNGDGTFVANPALALTSRPKLLAVADWNQDGRKDLAVLDSGIGGLNAVAWMALHNGSVPADTAPPQVALTVPAAGATVSGRVAVVANASDNVGVTHVDFYAGGKLIAKSAGPQYRVNWNTAASPTGTIALTAWAYDGAGNVTTSASVQVTVSNSRPPDTTPPVITVPANVTVEATGPNGAAVTFAVSATDNVDGTITPTCTPSSGAAFPLNTTTVTCTATDSSGNRASASFTVTVRDTTPPVVIVPANATLEATSGAGATFSFTASASDIVDGSVTTICAPASGTTFPLGTTTVACSATDAHGNKGSAALTVTVRDTTPPVVTAPPSVVLEATSPPGAIHTFAASASDVVDGAVAPICTPASGSTFPLRTTSVVCTATDAHGNTGSASFTVTVRDTTPPVIAAHGDVSAEATSSAGATVGYTAPPTTDAVDGTGTASCAPAAGTVFVLGATVVTCTAIDTAGNRATPTTFSVHVVDTTPPVVTVPANATVEATSATGATHSFTASATDAVDGSVATTCTPGSGATFPLGATTVTCSATDAHGNAGSASFVVTVQDTTPPIVTAPPSVVLEATSPAGTTHLFNASASDVVDGAVATVCTPASGSIFPLGTTTVVCRATDAHGNTGAASFTVTVRDTTPPTVTAPAAITVAATEAGGARGNVPAALASQQLKAFLGGGSAADLQDVAPARLVPQAMIDQATVAATADTLFPVGTTPVVFSFRDASGNVGTASSAVTVTPPVGGVVTAANQAVAATNAQNVPQPVTASFAGVTQPGLLTADVIPAPAAPPAGFDLIGDVFDVVTTALVTPPTEVCLLGSAFPADARVVHYDGGVWVDVTSTVTATRVCASVATLSPFAVITGTNHAPTADAGAPQTVEATSAAGAAVTLTGTGTDPDAGDTLTFRWAEGATLLGTSASLTVTLGLGTHTITLTVTDSRGASASADTVVTVRDTTPPTVTVPPNATIDATSASGAVFTFTTTASDIVNGQLVPSCTPPSGSTFPVGTTSVVCAAQDASGNTGSASFTVTVLAPATTNTVPIAYSALYTIRSNNALTGVLKATDADRDPLSFQLATMPSKGTVTISASTGAFTYTPIRRGAEGRDQFTFRVTDGKSWSNVAAVTVKMSEGR